MSKSLSILFFAVSMALAPVAFADSKCSCDKGCMKACEKGEQKDCKCESCDCSHGKGCKHGGKCKHHAKDEAAPKAE